MQLISTEIKWTCTHATKSIVCTQPAELLPVIFQDVALLSIQGFCPACVPHPSLPSILLPPPSHPRYIMQVLNRRPAAIQTGRPLLSAWQQCLFFLAVLLLSSGPPPLPAHHPAARQPRHCITNTSCRWRLVAVSCAIIAACAHDALPLPFLSNFQHQIRLFFVFANKV